MFVNGPSIPTTDSTLHPQYMQTLPKNDFYATNQHVALLLPRTVKWWGGEAG
jgi:hypothetical protein